ncbi:MAG: NAD/NADP octopine/nopaline dehydrogenase family protein [Clostridiales Family XIII bacterium]|nr:NAD/NADP octopine/nopaline dehydrogenase family protein [Clostridiales Family XIII bacterium]
MKIGILGAGAGGLALAADAASRGFGVLVADLPEFSGNTTAVKQRGGVVVRESNEETLIPVGVSESIPEVLRFSEVTFVVCPAFGTRSFAAACKPHAKAGHAFIVCPGSGGGALEFKNELGLAPDDASAIVADTHTLPYAARVTAPGIVRMIHRVRRLVWASLPSSGAAAVGKIMDLLWPGVAERARNVLEVALMDTNPVIHPAIMLLNTGLIERTKGDFYFYPDGITQSVSRVIEAVDRERIAIGEALGFALPTEPETSVSEGYMSPETATYFEGYVTSPIYGAAKAPETMEDRYITEDVSYVLVFWADLAKNLGVATPAIDAVIALTSAILGADQNARALRTMKRLGLTPQNVRTL